MFTFSIQPGADVDRAIGGKGLRPEMTRAEYDKLARSLPKYDGPRTAALPRQTVPRTPDPSKPRADVTRAADLDRAVPQTSEYAIGKFAAPEWRIIRCDGRAAICERAAMPPGERSILTDKATGVHLTETPIRWYLTPAIWCAYGRVRTCRPASKAITWDGGADVLKLTAATVGEWEAIETVSGQLVPAADRDLILTAISDVYVWPLRGTRAPWRQANGNSPVWIQYADDRAIAIQPMKV